MAFTEDEEQALRGIIAIHKSQAPSLSADVALTAAALYPEWSDAAVDYAEGERVRYQGRLYSCLQTHSSQGDWEPGVVGTKALWKEVTE